MKVSMRLKVHEELERARDDPSLVPGIRAAESSTLPALLCSVIVSKGHRKGALPTTVLAITQ